MESIMDATEKALDAAKRAGQITELDSGAVEALRALARKIDAWDLIVGYAMDDLAGSPREGRPAVPQNDNVSIPTYLKFCESLGLTPAGRLRLGEKKETAGGKLAQLRSVQGKRGA